ncbi:MAG: methyltransferase domain-containing protein [Candidatus Altiarchaeales archaeon]|nr:methyltransferase domain-containing protein [Candidatus Altiarchaeales archaeon]
MAYDLGGNGERIVIDARAIDYGSFDMYQRSHYRRYEFAKGLLKGGDVVGDFACGTGYGSVMLSEIASKVVGADIDSRVVEHIKEMYKDVGNVVFTCEDIRALQHVGIFDMIVSFETIEHLEENDIRKVLKIYHVALKPFGKLVFSVPYMQEDSEIAKKMGFHKTFHINEPKLLAWLNEAGFKLTQIQYQDYQTHTLTAALEKKDFIVCVAERVYK